MRFGIGSTLHARHAASQSTRRGGWRVVLVSAALLTAGCFRYTDLDRSAPVMDQRVEVQLNDAGRLALRDQVGSGARSIEGRVIGQSDEAFSLAVYRVTNIRDESFTWTGERVQVPVNGVEALLRRDFDAGRSAVAVATAAGAFAVFVASRNLLGGGRDRTTGEPPLGEAIRVLP